MEIYLDRFPEGRTKALTMSYDDGGIQDRRLIALFDSYGIRGTFHLNSGVLGSEGHIQAHEVKSLYKHHEVSVHTCTHPYLSRIPREMAIAEILDDRKALEGLVEYPVRGMSYPFASYDDSIVRLLPGLGIEYARIVASNQNFSIPDDFLRWSPTCHHNNENLPGLAEQFINLKPNKSMHLMYIWGHSYEFDRKNNWHVIEGFCKFIGNKEDIWYATNIEIVDYIAALKGLRFSASCEFVHNPEALDVWISVDHHACKIPSGETISLK